MSHCCIVTFGYGWDQEVEVALDVTENRLLFDPKCQSPLELRYLISFTLNRQCWYGNLPVLGQLSPPSRLTQKRTSRMEDLDGLGWFELFGS